MMLIHMQRFRRDMGWELVVQGRIRCNEGVMSEDHERIIVSMLLLIDM